MATDERRRIIYELMVEAKGFADQSRKAEAEMRRVGSAANEMGNMMKKALKGFGAAFAVRGVAEAISQTQKLNEQLRVLGVTASEDAAQGLKDVQNIAFATGQSFEGVAAVYGQAIEATQMLGRSQADAAKLANAFTRSVVAQGGSAEQAAEQLETLQFAFDKNNLNVKQFQQLLKSNEVLQQAAGQAFGKTTEEILKMAKAGEIGRDEIQKLLDVFIVLGEKQEIGVTFDRLIGSLKILAQTFISAAAEASGLSAALSVDSSGFADFLERVRGLGTAAGGTIQALFNLGQSLVNIVLLLKDVAAGNAATGWFEFLERSKRDGIDFAAGLEKMGAGLEKAATGVAAATEAGKGGGFAGTVADNWREAMTSVAADTDKAITKNVASIVDMNEAVLNVWGAAMKMPEAFEETFKTIRQEMGPLEDVRVDTEAFLDNAHEATKVWAEHGIDLDEISKGWEFINDQTREYERQAKRQREMSQDWGDAIRQAGKEMDEELMTRKEMALEAGHIIANAFAGLFSGATKNARDFFKTVLQGLAQMIAQQAALKAVSELFKLVGWSKGGVFSAGQVVPMAQGAVIGTPTLFPMASGQVGLMGEAGAEAVMPLRRTKSGRLGVEATGRSNVVVENHGPPMNANVLTSDDETRIVLRAASLGSDMAQANMTRSITSGYGTAAQSFQSTYGLRRRV